MEVRISDAMASADGLAPEDAALVRRLVETWRRHYDDNRLRDAYYLGHVGVKDFGVSVSPQLARKMRPHVDWAAKCVDWWADRVSFEGFTCGSEDDEATLRRVSRENDLRNLTHKAVLSALRHCCCLVAVTQGDTAAGEPHTVVSAYPMTAASAVWDDAMKRIRAALVVVETRELPGWRVRLPTLCEIFTDESLIVLRSETGQGWEAEYRPHSMGRVPVEPIAYHATLGRPFGSSRITRTVMGIVDDAQRELMNMAAAAAFSAAPQKYLLGADAGTAKKLADSPFAAYIGSTFVATAGSKGQVPQFGQLSQLTMQPHTEYMRNLAALFSSSTGVPLSSMGVVTDNPSSAEAIYAAKEDAIVDINAFVDGCKHAYGNVAAMVLASEAGTDYATALGATEVDVHFANPAFPSVVSESQAIMQQVQTFPWMADSDVPLRELGYTDEQVHQLRSDRRKSQARSGAATFLDRNQVSGADIPGGAESVSAGAGQAR